MEATVPTLTLSLGGVDFSLVPHDDDSGSVRFNQDEEQVLWNLERFSGTLRVALSTAATPKSSEHTSVPTKDKVEDKPVVQITPRASNSSQAGKRELVNKEETPTRTVKRTRSEEPELSNAVKSPLEEEESALSNPIETPEQQDFALMIQETEDTHEETATLLGQPDLSQTQFSSTQPTDEEPAAALDETCSMTQDVHQEPSRVQQIMEEGASLPCTPDSNKSTSKEVDADQDSVKSHSSIIMEDNNNNLIRPAAAPIPARVSVGGSPSAARRNHEPPCPRWGHTMTDIGSNRVLIYGGQTFDVETGTPKTLNDLHIFDTNKHQWYKPFNCEGMPRQWHSATYLPERQLLISFGGEAAHPKTGKVKTTDQVMVLDTEIMLWYPPTVSGDVPSGRSGHSSSLLPKTNELVVFGGVKGSKWLNSVSVLDTMRWKWTTPKIQGSAPKPRSYHSATVVSGGRIVIFGGNNAETSFDSVHVLETEGDKWRWSNIKALGYGPSPRTGHSATVLDDNKTICVYGGWDPNADEETCGEQDVIFDETFLLDTDKWTWKKGPSPIEANFGFELECGGPHRVGHAAVLSEDRSKVLVFGGRIPGDEFAGDFEFCHVK